MRAASGIYHLAAAQSRKRTPRQKNGSHFRKADRVQSIAASGVASQRRVCLTLGDPRSSVRYKPKRREGEESLRGRIKKLAKKHSRYGYRRIWATLRREGREVNIKRVQPFAFRLPSPCCARKGSSRTVSTIRVLRAKFVLNFVPTTTLLSIFEQQKQYDSLLNANLTFSPRINPGDSFSAIIQPPSYIEHEVCTLALWGMP